MPTDLPPYQDLPPVTSDRLSNIAYLACVAAIVVLASTLYWGF
jgi:hypothetical protein